MHRSSHHADNSEEFARQRQEPDGNITPSARLTIAPKLCPISWATTCHSTRPAVDTAVPDTIEEPLPLAVCWQRVASQAMPTSEPVGQPLIRCHRPALSLPFCPRHCENSESRWSSSTLLQSTFQGIFGSAVVGHLWNAHVQNRPYARILRAYVSF